ncbi:hypothetical protein EDS67_14580 [candidate division KSB1 bacterium]|nr:MAG: hypothetical protein EDS67_14580 [candidate division KSB1 bacterium]MBC6949289.1 hypothetical protein [candidate division KSB1 bacterium]MCE7941002.1 hypothetical protein [Chlorobi bacterium CHB1]
MSFKAFQVGEKRAGSKDFNTLIFFQIEEMVIAVNKIATIRVNRSSQNMVVLGIIVNDIEEDFS